MAWRTVAQGTTLETLEATVADREFGKGVPVRLRFTLNQPLAHLFDMAGAEQACVSLIPEGLTIKDVYSPDNTYEVIIDCESDPVWLVALVAFVKAHWLALVLTAIGLTVALGLLIIAIKIQSPEEALAEAKWIVWALVILAALILIFYLIQKGFIPKPGGT